MCLCVCACTYHSYGWTCVHSWWVSMSSCTSFYHVRVCAFIFVWMCERCVCVCARTTHVEHVMSSCKSFCGCAFMWFHLCVPVCAYILYTVCASVCIWLPGGAPWPSGMWSTLASLCRAPGQQLAHLVLLDPASSHTWPGQHTGRGNSLYTVQVEIINRPPMHSDIPWRNSIVCDH